MSIDKHSTERGKRMNRTGSRANRSDLLCNVSDYGITPDAEYPQTKAIQNVFDLCRENGGTVVFPKGTYRVSGLLLHSDTTVYLESGAVLLGSEECTDYALFDVPEHVQLRTDMELIPRYFGFKKREEYRRAMLSAYQEAFLTCISDSRLRGLYETDAR